MLKLSTAGRGSRCAQTPVCDGVLSLRSDRQSCAPLWRPSGAKPMRAQARIAPPSRTAEGRAGRRQVASRPTRQPRGEIADEAPLRRGDRGLERLERRRERGATPSLLLGRGDDAGGLGPGALSRASTSRSTWVRCSPAAALIRSASSRAPARSSAVSCSTRDLYSCSSASIRSASTRACARTSSTARSSRPRRSSSTQPGCRRPPSARV